jgi:hypothetical protein
VPYCAWFVGLAYVEGSVQQIDDTLFKTLRVSWLLCFCASVLDIAVDLKTI